MLSLKNFTIKQKNKPIIKNINLEIPESIKICVISDNALNVNLFLKTLGGLQQYDGQYLIDDVSVKSVNKGSFYIPRELLLTGFRTIKHIVKFYNVYYKITKHEIRDYLKMYGFILDTPLSSLTMSDLKLINLIIAISTKCKYIVADGLFDGLSMNAKQRIVELFNSVEYKPTLILSSHNPNDYLNFVDHVIYINREGNLYFKSILEYFKEFVKIRIGYADYVTPDMLRVIKTYYEKVEGKRCTLIVKNNIHKVTELLSNGSVVYHEFLDMMLDDLYYCMDCGIKG